MEKLLNYLKEYAPDYCKELPDDVIMDEIVISKRFGFIKRLVDNDKINLFSRNALFISESTENGEKQRPYSFYEEMLIRLAISDTPIEDLISYLK